MHSLPVLALLVLAGDAQADAPPATVEVQYRTVAVRVGPAADALADAGVRNLNGEPVLLTPAQLAAVDLAGRGSADAGASPWVALAAGQTANVLLGQQAQFTTGHERKPAASDVVPRAETVATGSQWDLRADPTADRGAVRLAVQFRDVAVDPVVPVGYQVLAGVSGASGGPVRFGVQRPSVRRLELDRTATVPDGQTVAFFAGTRWRVAEVTRTAGYAPLAVLNRLTTSKTEAVDEDVYALVTVKRTGAPAPTAADWVAKYHKALADGKPADAARHARTALDLDPACFAGPGK